MRFESVRAYAFGPFRDEELPFEPGMNIIYGPNEAGKSTWHSALYAGLCGQRRGRGRQPKSDSDFQEHHEPWDDKSAWEVGAVVALDQGIRVELRHDLSGRVPVIVRDADIAGRDCANDIMYEGSPDGSRWLGLNRRSFLSVACVRQADILGILDNADALQEDLQRAAATAGTHETAAGALTLLTDYRAEHVGSQRAPTKPLQKSARQVSAARDALDVARKKHAEHLDRLDSLAKLEQSASESKRQFDAARVVRAMAEATRAQRRLGRIRELSAQFPDGAPHFSHGHDRTAQRIGTALSNWETRPQLHTPEGPTVCELEQQITGSRQRLDAARALVTEKHAKAASRRFDRAQQLDGLFPNGPPHYSSEHDRQAEQVARALEHWRTRSPMPTLTGPTEQELERELTEIDRRLTEPTLGLRRMRSVWVRIAAAVIFVAGGIITALLGFSGSGLPASLVGMGSLAVCGALLLGLAPRLDALSMAYIQTREIDQERSRRIAQQLADRRAEEKRYERDAGRRQEAANAVRAATNAVGAHGGNVDAEVQALGNWQEQRSRDLEKHERKTGEWDELQQLLAGQTLDQIAREAKRLSEQAETLAARAGKSSLSAARKSPTPTEEQLSRLEQQSGAECDEWQEAIGRRREEDDHYAEHKQQCQRLEEAVREAAISIGENRADIAAQLQAVRGWQERRTRELNEHERRTKEWDEFQQLLAGQTLDEVIEEAELRCEEARRSSGAVDGCSLDAARVQPWPDERLAELEDHVGRARRAVATARGELTEFISNLPSVADAEDALEAATHEHNRVKRLDSTLATTIKFLECAEERVNRNLAPVLRRTVIEWLPRVTGGRYVDCRVDPESLAVEVSGADGRWRAANLLSHGTAEQVYLLLRVALARHLAKPGEGCPLILDDATGASDAERKRVLLDTLLAISRSVQVILFTHDDQVRAWAKERLCAHPNLLIELDRGVA